jgi:hypothetical protein
MDLRELKAKGGFVSAEPVPVEVTWKHGKDADTFTVHVVKQSFGAVESLFKTTDDRSRSASFIAAAIRLGDGKERMSYDDAYALDPSLATVMVEAINKVNGTDEKVKGKN